ncbi:MAG: 3'-5' exonuclease [Bacteroidales bacterium]|nr:3'-5' exonuclease [Bacteroidales bacterium]
MLNKIDLEKILFIDIETVSQYKNYSEIPEKMRIFWDKKAQQLDENTLPEEQYNKAAIYAEFGKIVCISFCYIRKNNNKLAIFVKSIFGHDEKNILLKFNKMLDGYYNTENHFLCAHNGKEFDFPFIARRTLINQLNLATILNTPGAKPWEIRHLDTLALWRFGDYKNWTSLDLLAAIFDIPSPKTDIDGSMVGKIYWENNDLERIVKYCQQDVVAVAQIFLRYINKTIIPEDLVFFK